jgi:hypothetical protein
VWSSALRFASRLLPVPPPGTRRFFPGLLGILKMIYWRMLIDVTLLVAAYLPQKIISHGFNYWNDRYDTLKEKCPA